MTTPKEKRGPRIWLLALLSLGGLSLVALVALGVARFTVFIPYKQPSGSMYPAIEHGELLYANGLDKTPARGAVMVFRFPERREQLFDKRVIGLPGDVVRTKGRAVFVNDWEIPRCVVGKHSYKDPTNTEHTGELELELLGDASYLVFHEEGAFAVDEAGPWHVQEGQYFVLGDNRNNSHDSRMWFGGVGGGVPYDDTVARVRGLEQPKLPPGADALQAAFEACLAKRPAQTTPPAPK